MLSGGVAATVETSTAALNNAQMLPNRTLTCVLGRATNLNPHIEQKVSEVIYEGKHKFSIFLPSEPVRTAPPPDAIKPAEPVNPRMAILADPDGLTAEAPKHFDRVVDYWPRRVEMATTINDPLTNLIIITDYNETTHTASLFMTEATDLATMDLKHVYQGRCDVAITAPAVSTAR